ncbi:TetR family transcriptional regulator [Actinomadura sp. CNU-125]|uniref:TetR/AcrR family transcriptional regulator n=1 Tax=Actinomadura sp. CNU-125 TaxID=1904961 RepID=UPI00095923AB|nr:TetR/AcrR family transcriptional regulator [Actinomadura sp. CNU-125]OLT30205.1 TetR family transcriptional regulator [Actinomadura sp. CNU-125]
MTSAATGSRGRYARTAERRRTIARAVLDIVREKGHGGVTTAEVADRAGTSEATVLYHYSTKDHLLVAALRRFYEEDDERLSPGDASLDLERLGAYARSLQHDHAIVRLHTLLAGHAATPGHPAQEYFAEHYRAAVTRWAAIIERRQSTGTAHPDLDPTDVARQFIATWEGLRAQWLVDPGFDLGDTVVAAFRRLTAQNWMEARSLLLAPGTGT